MEKVKHILRSYALDLIMGVGAAERYKAVHWIVARRILLSWFITIPVAGTLGALLFVLLSQVF